jgi:zinc transporter, ZIP family
MVSSKEIVFTLIPVLLWYIGGMIAYFKPPGAALKSIILHFAAGVVFSVVAVELLPDMIKIHDAKSIIIGFSSGVAAMLLIKYFTGKIQPAVKVAEVNGLPWGVLIAMGIDLLIDGILLGIGFAAGEKEGVLLAVALALECLSLGIATVTSLSGSSPSKKVIHLTLLAMALVFISGAALGLLLLHNTSDNVLELILSFGSAALLFLVTEELLVEAHEEKETAFYTASFFTGFLIFMILGMML